MAMLFAIDSPFMSAGLCDHEKGGVCVRHCNINQNRTSSHPTHLEELQAYPLVDNSKAFHQTLSYMFTAVAVLVAGTHTLGWWMG